MKIPVAELIRRADKTRQRELILPAITPPMGLERDLLGIYVRVVRAWGEAWRDRILPTYQATLGDLVRDAPSDVQGEAEDAGAALSRLVVTLGPVLEDWVVRVEQWHRGRTGQLFTPVGVRLDTLLGQGDVSRTLEAVLADNTALIRSLSDQMRNGISGAVFRGLTNRSPARDVAAEIRKATGVARRRAELIAADQLQKLTGRLDQERQEQLGIDEFVWTHSRKKNPREEHRVRDGKRYRWDSAVAKTDPPGRAIRCGCKARAVVKLDDELQAETEAIAEPAPPPPPKPKPAPPPPPKPKPAPVAGFRSPVNPDVRDDTVRVEPRLKVQKRLSAEFTEHAKHPEYVKHVDRWGQRSPKDHGKAVFSAAFDDETVSMIAAIKPELDDLADQIGIPRVRGFKSGSGTSYVANQGDGVMALNPSYFNGYADRVGGRAPGGAMDAVTAERNSIAEKMKPLAARFTALRDDLGGTTASGNIAVGGRDAAWLEKYDALEQLRAELNKLRSADEKLWKKQQALKRTNAQERTTSTWKPGDDVKARPYNTDAYFEGMDRARQTMFHEFGHHVHQSLKFAGSRRAYGPPPLERELRVLYMEMRRDGERFRRQPSGYSTKDEYEWFAENFAAFVMGRRDLVDSKLGGLIERIFRREY